MATKSLESAQPEIVSAGAVNEMKIEIPTSYSDLVNDIKNDFKNLGTISVKPYVDPKVKNMGLENYNMSLFPGTKHKESLAAIEINGRVKYVTGLDEYAPVVQNIRDENEKNATIKYIRSIVAYLERVLATNIVNPEDPDFWNKVKELRPDNKKFWDEVYMECGNEPVFLEPAKEPSDLIKLIAIEAGGFDMIAKSYEDAESRAVRPKFYLDKQNSTIAHKAEGKKIKNKALAMLEKISSNTTKMLYVAKIVDTNGARFKLSTPSDVLYDVINDYIEGLGSEKNTQRSAERFMELCQLDLETLKLKAMAKDGMFFKTISLRPDGMMYHTKSNIMMGRNISDVVMFLKNPINDDVTKVFINEINNYWK